MNDRATRILLHAALLCLMALAASCLAGCKSTSAEQQLAQTRTQAMLVSLTEAVRLKATRNDGPPLAGDTLSNTPELGAAGVTYMGSVAKNPVTGEPILINGVPLYDGGWAIGLCRSMRDFGNVTEGIFGLGVWSRCPKDYTIAGVNTDGVITPQLDGLFLHVKGEGITAGMNSDFAAAWGAATVEEKNAAAAALKGALEARLGGYATIVTDAGAQVQGVLKEVLSVVPVYAGQALVKAAVMAGTERFEGSMVENFVTLPDGTAATVTP